MPPPRLGLTEFDQPEDDQQPEVVVPAPPPPPPAPVPSPSVGFVDDSGYNTVVADSVAAQWQPEPYVPDPDIGFVEDVTSPNSLPTYGYGPAAPDSGTAYFAEPVAQTPGSQGITEFDQGPGSGTTFAPWQPDVSFVSNEDYFSSGDFANLGAAPPTPGDGSLWFGTPEEQNRQAGWWQGEVDKAIADGDMQKYQQLLDEADRVEQGWQAYGQQFTDWQTQQDALMQRMGQAFAFDPAGEGGFVRQRGASSGLPWEDPLNPTGRASDTLVSRESLRGQADRMGTPTYGYTADGELMLRSDIRRQMDEQAQFAASQSMIDAESDLLSRQQLLTPDQRQQQADMATFAANPLNQPGALNRRFGQDPDFRPEDSAFYGPNPDTPNPVGTVLGGALRGAQFSATKGGQALTYAQAADAYYLQRAFGGNQRADQARAEGKSYLEYARETYDTQNAVERFIVEAIGDPLNYVPIGGWMVKGAGKVAEVNRARTVSKVMGAALTADEQTLLVRNLSHREIVGVDRAAEDVFRQIGGRSDLDMAVSQRIAAMKALEARAGGTINADWLERTVMPNIEQMAADLGATPKQIADLRTKLGNDADGILALGPGSIADTPVARTQTVTSSANRNALTMPDRPVLALGPGDGRIYATGEQAGEAQRIAAQADEMSGSAVRIGPGGTRTAGIVTLRDPATISAPQRIAKASDEVAATLDSVTPARDVPRPTPRKDRYTTGTDYVRRNPTGYVPVTPGTTTWDPDLLINEEQVHALGISATNPRVTHWDPLGDLERLPTNQRTVQWAEDKLVQAPPSVQQARMADDLATQGHLTKQQAKAIAQGKTTAREAFDTIAAGIAKRDGTEVKSATATAADLAAKGHDVPLHPDNPAFGPKLDAAAQDAAARKVIGDELDQLLPTRGSARNLPIDEAGTPVYARQAQGRKYGDIPQISVQRFREMLRANDELIEREMPDLKPFFTNLTGRGSRNYLTIGGTLSADTANAIFWDHLDDLAKAVTTGQIDTEQVRAFHKMLVGEYTGADSVRERLVARAQAWLDSLPQAKRDGYLAQVAERTARNDDLLRDMRRLKPLRKDDPAARKAFEDARQEAEINTQYIKRIDPTYEPKTPKLTPSERVAARDAQMREQGLDITPTTPPEYGFDTAKAGSDSTNDTLTQIVQHPDVEPRHEVVFTPKEPTPVRGVRQRLKDARQAMADDAAGLGIVPSEFARRISLRPVRPVLNPYADAWATTNWADPEVVKGVNAVLDRVYDYSDLPTKGVKGLNPALLSTRSQITRTTDIIENSLNSWLGEAYGTDDPMGFIQGNLFKILDPATPLDEVVKIAPQFGERAFAEELRTLRRYRTEITDHWYAFDPNRSVAKVPGVPQVSAHGRLDAKQMDALDTFITGAGYPPETDRVARQYIDNLREELWPRWAEAKGQFRDEGTGTWNTLDGALEQGVADARAALPEMQTRMDAIRLRKKELDAQILAAPTGQTRALRTELANVRVDEERLSQEIKRANSTVAEAERAANAGAGIHIDDINRVLFPDEANAPLDIQGHLRNLTGMIAEREAKRLGFDPDDIPFDLQVMAWTKGNLAPLWMTVNPSYTINNLGGNIASQLLGWLHSGMHGGLLWNTDRAWKAARAEAGSSIHSIAYLDTGFIQQTEQLTNRGVDSFFVPKLLRGTADVSSKQGLAKIPEAATLVAGKALNPGQLANAGIEQVFGKRLRGLDQVGTGGWHDFWRGTSEKFEQRFKEAIYSKEFMYTYRADWSKGITALDLPTAARDDLVQAVGSLQTKQALMKHGIEGDTARQVMALNRAAVARASNKGYETTATILRDYRMRNQFDAVLDRVVPIHYWTTKNALFVGRVAANRPGVALTAMRAYDAWQEANVDMPFSLRTGLIPIPGSVVPFADDSRDYWFRVSQLTNPALFTVPKLFDKQYGFQWDGDVSLKDRVVGASLNGFANLWDAAGYQMGGLGEIISYPVSALANSKLLNKTPYVGEQAQYVGALMASGLNFMVSPSGYRKEIIPFQNQVIGRSALAQQGAEWWNTRLYGTPYTRMDIANFSRYITEQQHTGAIDTPEAQRLYLLLADGNYNDPALRKIIGTVQGDSADAQIRAKMGMSGTEYGKFWQDAFEANETYWQMRDNGDPSAVQTWARLNKRKFEQPFRDWLDAEVAGGRIDEVEARAAIDDVLNRGNLANPLFQDAVAAAQRRKEQYGDGLDRAQLTTIRDMVVADATYKARVEQSGARAANKWMRDNAPFLPGYWLANGDSERVKNAVFEEQAYSRIDQMYDERNAHYRETQPIKQPYYDRLDQITLASDQARARANGDQGQLAIIDKTEREMIAGVYNDADEAGVSLIGSGNLPLRAPSYYDKNPDLRRFLKANDDTGQWDAHEAAKAQRGWLLDQTADVLGLDSRADEFKDENGFFDRATFEAAVREKAKDAPAIYQQLADNVKTLGDASGVRGGLTFEADQPISADDLIFHLRDKYPNETIMQNEISAYYDMPSGDAKDAERQRLVDTYGEQVFAVKPQNASFNPDGSVAIEGFDQSTPEGQRQAEVASANANTRYKQGTQAINDLYFTLTPRQKAEFKEQYGGAFVTEKATDEATGREYEYDKLVVKNLTAEQVQQIEKDFAINPSGTPRGESLERIGFVPASVDDVSATDAALVKTKADEYRALVTTEDEFAVNQFFTVKDDPRFKEAQALAEAHPTKAGKPGWYWVRNNAPGYGDVIDAYFAAIDAAGPVWDKQEAWFNDQPEDVRQLLIAEDPTFAKYGDQPADGGGSTANTSQTTQDGAGASDVAQTTKKPFTPFTPFPARSGGSGGFSSTPRTSLPRSSGGSSGGGSQPSSVGGMDFGSILNAFDPVLASGQDDGRGAIVGQVASILSSRLAFVFFLPKAWQQTLLGMWASGFRKQLGANPTLDTWTQLLENLQRPVPPPQTSGMPTAAPSPLRAADALRTYNY